MNVRARTRRGPGVETVHKVGRITPETVSLSQTRRTIQVRLEDGASVSIWIDELRTLVEFLRSKGVELDPLRDKQRKLAWALAQSLGPQPTAEPPNPI
jgi:hypothetical protein